MAWDPWILLSVLALLGLGLVMVLSASAVMAERVYGDEYYFFRRQAVYALIGLGAMFAASRVPMRLIYRTVYVWLILAFILLALTLTPLGVSVGGASRWLRIGPMTLQPLEPAKVALVLYLAYFFSHKQDKVKTFSVGFFPPVVMTGLMAGMLALQPDFGGAVFVTALFAMLSLVGGARLVYLFCSLALCFGAGTLMILQSPYRLQRWLGFLHPFQNAQDIGYQIVQSLYGLGAGGIFGQGLGSGRQKLFFLPEAHTDFILAVLGEELGFIGLSFVFICLGIFMIRSFMIALQHSRLQDRFSAFGLSLVLILGALLNMAVVLGTVPPKGLPMPFISYGGSNLLMMCICAGLIMNISKRRGQVE
jgi:cell division protein FtsW